MELKTPEQLVAMRRAGLVVAQTHVALREAAAPGVTTGELDVLAREVLARHGATSSFLGYDGGYDDPPFPAVTCISVNEEIVHGIPGDRVLAAGDLVSVDFGAIVDGWHGDGAITFGVGELSPADARLSDVTREAMWAGIGAAHLRGRVGDISHAVERRIREEPLTYGIVRDFTGHGIGSAMHQPPDVPNYGRPGRGTRIVEGLALAIEPMVTLGSEEGLTLDDDWTVVTADGSRAAHWEHTMTVTSAGLWILTALDGGEAELTARGLPYGPLAD
ncbi:type I methionyl aminopeptidase [Propioniciclava flava]|uniref:type I methionyl aminopeptidase n=1 Tax=Propioniciclava flava TaxID=2072026 RepID=UPI002545CCAA|nr:type I methionyl aminopeptidase [Propioniciclava flava]